MTLKKMIWEKKAPWGDCHWGKHIVEVRGDFPETSKTIQNGRPAKTVSILKVLRPADMNGFGTGIITGYHEGRIHCAYLEELSEIE